MLRKCVLFRCLLLEITYVLHKFSLPNEHPNVQAISRNFFSFDSAAAVLRRASCLESCTPSRRIWLTDCTIQDMKEARS